MREESVRLGEAGARLLMHDHDPRFDHEHPQADEPVGQGEVVQAA